MDPELEEDIKALVIASQDDSDALDDFLKSNNDKLKELYHGRTTFHPIIDLAITLPALPALCSLVKTKLYYAEYNGTIMEVFLSHYAQQTPKMKSQILKTVRLILHEVKDAGTFKARSGESILKMALKCEHPEITKLFLFKAKINMHYIGEEHEAPLVRATSELNWAIEYLVNQSLPKSFQTSLKKAYRISPNLVCDFVIELFQLDPETNYDKKLLDISFPPNAQAILVACFLALPTSPELEKLIELLMKSQHKNLIRRSWFNEKSKQHLKHSGSAELFSNYYDAYEKDFCQYISALFELDPENKSTYPLTHEDDFTFHQERILLNHILTLPSSTKLKKICYGLGERFYIEQNPSVAYYFFEKAGTYELKERPSADDWKKRCRLTIVGIKFFPSEDIQKKVDAIVENTMLYNKLTIKLQLAKKYFSDPESILNLQKLEQDIILLEEKDKPLPRGIIQLAIAEFIFECVRHPNPLISKKAFLLAAKNYIETNKPTLMEVDKEATNTLIAKIEQELAALSVSSNRHAFNNNTSAAASPQPLEQQGLGIK